MAEKWRSHWVRKRKRHKLRANTTPWHERPQCKATTTRGTRCRDRVAWSIEWDRAVSDCCQRHGGLSTGPRTQEGKARIAIAARRIRVVDDIADIAPGMDAATARSWGTAIAVLAIGGTYDEAAEAAGIAVDVLDGWMADPAFDTVARRAVERVGRNAAHTAKYGATRKKREPWKRRKRARDAVDRLNAAVEAGKQYRK